MADSLQVDGLYERVIEVIKVSLGEVFQNIHDPNTSPDKSRKVTVTIELKPSKDRSMVSSKVQAKISKVPAEPVEMTIMSGRDIKTGEVYARDLVGMQDQIGIDDYDEEDVDMETGEILSFKDATGGAK